jgi:hypothetical protein
LVKTDDVIESQDEADVVQFVKQSRKQQQQQPVTMPRLNVEPPAVVEQVDEDVARQVVQADSPSRDDVERARMQPRPLDQDYS